ncbi:CDGSH iron-sulfur domain-containing protein [Dehalococcoidia bacterium]|nr:CDGSH iron-sulfur domain-containing protein [Dehalococcoidia bacterium]
MVKPKIRATDNGPLHVQGVNELLDGLSQPLKVENEIWLCRCGCSKNKPFCDGSHNKVNFKDESRSKD